MSTRTGGASRVRAPSTSCSLRERPRRANGVSAGVGSDGQPWLALEYVQGERLDTLAARRPLAERLALFVQVVRAVGGRAPLHLTSVGKLFLAHDDPQRVRAYAARTGLAGHTRNSITDIAVAFGFSSMAHFSRVFRAHLGLPPSDYRRGVA